MTSGEDLVGLLPTSTEDDDNTDTPASSEHGLKALLFQRLALPGILLSFVFVWSLSYSRNVVIVPLLKNADYLSSISKMNFSTSNSTDKLFLAPCDEGTTCKLPKWMLQYFHWHQRTRNKLKTSDDWLRQPLLLVRCYEGDRCGGTSDRLKALPFYLAVAAKTRRLLLIRWVRPLALETFLTPRSINWTVPSNIIPLMENTTSTTFSGATDLRGLINKASSRKRWWLVQAAVQRPAIDQYHELVLSMGPSSLTTSDEVTKPPAYIFRDMFFSLFQPSDAILLHTKRQLQTLQLVPNHFVAVQIRAKYPGEPYRVSKNNLTVLAQVVSNAIECASSLAPAASDDIEPFPVYVASDTVLALEAAHTFGQKTTYRIVSSLDSTSPADLEQNGLVKSNVHLNFKNDDSDPSAYFSIFVDLLIMSQSQCVSYGAGGFGLFGSWLSFNVSCSLEHSIKGGLQQCHRPLGNPS